MNDELVVGVQIKLTTPDDFLKCKETLSRIGVANTKEMKLFQSCHILHKRGKYYITHFKELFILDGKPSTLTVEDVQRRNLIVSLLKDWGLVEIVDSSYQTNMAPTGSVKVITHAEKPKWTLIAKYTVGNRRR